MEVVIKNPITIKVKDIPIGGCFKFLGKEQDLYMRIPTTGINLVSGRDAVGVNLRTGELMHLIGTGHDVCPVKAKVIEE